MQMNVKFLTLRATGRAERSKTSDKGHCLAILNPFSHVYKYLGTALSSKQADEQADMLASKWASKAI